MRAYRLTEQQAKLFEHVCLELDINTEHEKILLLEEMASLGLVDGITHTTMTKEEYLKHMSDTFGDISEIKEKHNDSDTES